MPSRGGGGHVVVEAAAVVVGDEDGRAAPSRGRSDRADDVCRSSCRPSASSRSCAGSWIASRHDEAESRQRCRSARRSITCSLGTMALCAACTGTRRTSGRSPSRRSRVPRPLGRVDPPAQAGLVQPVHDRRARTAPASGGRRLRTGSARVQREVGDAARHHLRLGGRGSPARRRRGCCRSPSRSSPGAGVLHRQGAGEPVELRGDELEVRAPTSRSGSSRTFGR